ncbi:MAG TPA: rhodanese-like domain-containing protein [Anaeromyxobacteraceae bacterium]|nr:rhodanese-like domain-containing protein [Anaeromyxobacteraceae bacterium]
MEVTRITPRQVVARLSQGQAVAFVDCRDEVTWRAGGWKVKNALRVSPRRIREDAGSVPRDGLVVVYADCEATAARHAGTFRDLGWGNELAVLVGGFSAWSQARYPVEPVPTTRLRAFGRPAAAAEAEAAPVPGRPATSVA